MRRYGGSFWGCYSPGEHAAIRSVDACLTSSASRLSLAKNIKIRISMFLHITTADELVLFDGAPRWRRCARKPSRLKPGCSSPFFNYDDYETLGHKLKCNPSVKTSFHQEAPLERRYLALSTLSQLTMRRIYRVKKAE